MELNTKKMADMVDDKKYDSDRAAIIKKNNDGSIKTKDPDIKDLGKLSLGKKPEKTMNDVMESLKFLASQFKIIYEGDKDDDPEEMEIEDITSGDSKVDDSLVNDLDSIFTPILVRQSVEADMSEEMQESFSNNPLMLEQNVINLDNETRLAILRSTAALLIAKKNNSDKYKAWEEAQALSSKLKLEIQKEFYDDSTELVKSYLDKVKGDSNEMAKKAAESLSNVIN